MAGGWLQTHETPRVSVDNCFGNAMADIVWLFMCILCLGEHVSFWYLIKTSTYCFTLRLVNIMVQVPVSPTV